jgi:plastocyanin
MSRRWNPRRWKARVPVAVVGAFALLVAACGGGGGSADKTRTAVNGSVDVNAKDPYSFDVKTIKASPGKLTINLHEKGGQTHTFTIKDPKFEIKVTPSAPEASGTVELAPGTYKFECSFDGHAAAGMTGQIIVA